MLRTAAVIALVASALTAAGSPVAAQDATPFERGRLDAARQHMNSVCRPLEAQRQYDKAYRCYSNVTRFLDNPALASIDPIPARPARVAASRADYPVAVVPFRPQRPASGLLASNHILIGVGF